MCFDFEKGHFAFFSRTTAVNCVEGPTFYQPDPDQFSFSTQKLKPQFGVTSRTTAVFGAEAMLAMWSSRVGGSVQEEKLGPSSCHTPH